MAVRVHDASPVEPATPDCVLRDRHDAEPGRGLAIVSELALDVGFEQIPADGKVVHASFGVAA